MKFTDEELSRILSAHEGGQLCQGGETWAGYHMRDSLRGYMACVIQAGKVVSGAIAASRINRRLAANFDSEYRETDSTDHLLRWLEAQGVA